MLLVCFGGFCINHSFPLYRESTSLSLFLIFSSKTLMQTCPFPIPNDNHPLISVIILCNVHFPSLPSQPSLHGWTTLIQLLAKLGFHRILSSVLFSFSAYAWVLIPRVSKSGFHTHIILLEIPINYIKCKFSVPGPDPLNYNVWWKTPGIRVFLRILSWSW